MRRSSTFGSKVTLRARRQSKFPVTPIRSVLGRGSIRLQSSHSDAVKSSDSQTIHSSKSGDVSGANSARVNNRRLSKKRQSGFNRLRSTSESPATSTWMARHPQGTPYVINATPEASKSRVTDRLFKERRAHLELRKSLTDITEKLNSTHEELQAAGEELLEYRGALNVARSRVAVFSAENAALLEKTNILTQKLNESHRNELRLRSQLAQLSRSNGKENQKVSLNLPNEEQCARKFADERKKLILQLNSVKDENLALKNQIKVQRMEIEKLSDDNLKLRSSMQAQQDEWNQLQSDLLVAVKVANDFKLEAQEELARLMTKLNESNEKRKIANWQLQSSVTLEESCDTWKDVAWQRLMRKWDKGPRRNALLDWCKKVISPCHPAIHITNFSTSWADGLVLCCLLSALFPKKIIFDECRAMSPSDRIDAALRVGNSIGLTAPLKKEDFNLESGGAPKWAVIMEYVLNIYFVVSG
ncbi:hypothetical protein AB6A40_001508 [Gnathostoma spinigerum]|uniref:Calponin-homology (CH) domain-containing protein n=1 Tax=Gnathostoma spinigerum TaxID=75299 RepID=A0ABD6E9H0_9BILA